MLAILYIIVSCFTGYILTKKLLPCLFKIPLTQSFFDKPVKLDNRMVTIPASFLSGTMVLTWSTYLISYLFRNTKNPLLFGNLISLTVFFLFILFSAIKERQQIIDLFRNSIPLQTKKTPVFEIVFVSMTSLISTFLMFYTFNFRNGNINVGVSVFSDFGPHLALIRSFSFGSNFPTQYPHFPDGNIRYHFLFQFLAGNLEFLGLRLDLALNLPSILSLVSLFMLFYSFSVIIFGEKSIGALAAILFFFRSSYASLSYLTDLNSNGQPLTTIFKNENFIGKTAHEDWGLFAQNVYVNQRHFAFSLAFLMLTLIIIIPLFKKMIFTIQTIKDQPYLKIDAKKSKVSRRKYNKRFLLTSTAKKYFREIFLTKDSWLPSDYRTAISLGVLLGLMGFFNGAVLIATISILFGLALFSKHRLEYAIAATISITLFLLEVKFFIKAGNLIGQNKLIFLGFLANIPSDLAYQVNSYLTFHEYLEVIRLVPKLLKYIFLYYIELLGILPAIMLVALLSFSGKTKWLSVAVLIPLLAFYFLYNRITSVNLLYIVLIMFVVLASTIMLIVIKKEPIFPSGIRLMILAFCLPLLMATTLQLTPDIAVNHKYVMISSMLLSPIAASFLYTLFKSRGTAILAIVLTIVMVSSGMIDFIALSNKDRPSKSIMYNYNDPITVWVKANTNPKDVFLTGMSVINPILLAGRSIYYGWPYFAWSAGYDTNLRENIVNQIYGSTHESQVKALVKNYGINYIVIDNETRASTSYKLNEALISKAFKTVYNDNGITIFQT